MRAFFLLVLSAAMASPSTCAIDDCTLSASMHSLSSDVQVPLSRAWMVHDLADIRSSLSKRDTSNAARRASELHVAVSAMADHVSTESDARFLLALHDDLSEVLREAGWSAPATPVLPYIDQALSRR